MPNAHDFFPVNALLSLPLLAFLILWLAGKKINKWSALIGSIVTAMGLFGSIAYIDPSSVQVFDINWFRIGERAIQLNFRIDYLTYLMLIVVHFVALLVQIYSASYLKTDPNLNRYFAFIQLFLFSMFGIVLSGNLLVMYIFWELVGLSSYLLIGFWYKKARPVWAAQKAFVLNRMGDAAFLTGILLLYYYTGTSDLESFSYAVAAINPGMMTFIGICLFGGCMGKSAQFPLSGWLPDAMEGPTPVSALIHAATMVAAGIFLLARIVNLLTPDAQLFIAVIGTITMVIGAVKAMSAWDIKRVLAYSTMSQLGLMVTAVGMGSWQMAVFHLITHAFFKAGLFLSAGSVIHALHPHGDIPFDPQDMRNMGGLRKKMPITFLCYVVCAASLAGLPLFSGFLSKDGIITEGFVQASNWGLWGYLFPVIIIISAGLTAFYMLRQVWLVFFGASRFDTSFVQPHESSVKMWLPMSLLAVLSLFGWFSFNPFSTSHSWLLGYLGMHEVSHLAWAPFVAFSVSLLALFLAFRAGTTGKFLTHLFLADSLNFIPNGLRDYSMENYFIIPFEYIYRVLGKMERYVIDAVVNGVGKLAVVLAHVLGWVDKVFVDGSVNLMVAFVQTSGNFVRGFQNGKIQSYFLVTASGVVLLILWLLFLI